MGGESELHFYERKKGSLGDCYLGWQVKDRTVHSGYEQTDLILSEVKFGKAC